MTAAVSRARRGEHMPALLRKGLCLGFLLGVLASYTSTLVLTREPQHKYEEASPLVTAQEESLQPPQASLQPPQASLQPPQASLQPPQASLQQPAPTKEKLYQAPNEPLLAPALQWHRSQDYNKLCGNTQADGVLAAASEGEGEGEAKATEEQVFSLSRCVGVLGDFSRTPEHLRRKMQPITAEQARSCHFRNVCLEAKEDGSPRLLFFRGPQERVVEMTTWADPYNYYWPLFTKVDVRVAEGTVPANALWVKDVGVAWRGKHMHNIGHIAFDNILPMFTLLHMFGMQGRDLLPVQWDEPIGQTLHVPGPTGTHASWRKATNKVLGTWLGSKAADSYCETTARKYLAWAAKRDRPLCFRNLLSGLSLLTDHFDDVTVHGRDNHLFALNNIKQERLLKNFRDEFLRRAGGELATESMVDVLVVNHASRGFNNREVVRAIRARGLTVKEPLLHTMSFGEQLVVHASAKVVVGVPSGGTMTAVWLPPGGTLLLLHGGSDIFDRDLFGRLPHMRTELVECKRVRRGLTCDAQRIAALAAAAVHDFPFSQWWV